MPAAPGLVVQPQPDSSGGSFFGTQAPARHSPVSPTVPSGACVVGEVPGFGITHRGDDLTRAGLGRALGGSDAARALAAVVLRARLSVVAGGVGRPGAAVPSAAAGGVAAHAVHAEATAAVGSGAAGRAQDGAGESPRPAVTVDCVVFGLDEEDLKVLLIQRGVEPYQGC